LKKWKGELFAIIEPLGKPFMNYSPDGAGYLEHYRLLCDTLRMINQNAKSLVSFHSTSSGENDQKLISFAIILL